MKNMKENTKKTARIFTSCKFNLSVRDGWKFIYSAWAYYRGGKETSKLDFRLKEYIVGNNVGDKDSVTDRNVLQEALRDAENREYDILLAYKDDRLGRRMLEIPMYIMSLKQFGVDVYTVKDGLLTPDLGDVMGMLKLAMQYGMAEKTV